MKLKDAFRISWTPARMTSFRPGKKFWVQCLLLSVVVFASVVPFLVRGGTNVVTDTYTMATERLWGGSSPYHGPTPGRGVTDWFKYSPLFALLYKPLTLFDPIGHALLWAWLNIFIFWMGVSAWFEFGRKTHWGLWAALIAAAMEVNISNLYQQINPLLTGMILLALAAYRDHRDGASGTVLALATNIKVFPAPFLLLLGIPNRNRYRLAALGCLLGSVLVPVLVVGWNQNLLFHSEWVGALIKDTHRQGIADLGSFLGRIGFPRGDFVRHAVMLTTIAALGLPLIRRQEPPWGLWFSLGATAILLWNPRTESPTFVLGAPAYLFVMDSVLGESRFRKAGMGVVLICMFLITVSFTEVWPKSIWDPYRTLTYASKTVGTLVLWGLANILFFRRLTNDQLPLRSYRSIASP